MQGRLLLDIVIRESAAILESFASKDEAAGLGECLPYLGSWP